MFNIKINLFRKYKIFKEEITGKILLHENFSKHILRKLTFHFVKNCIIC